MCIRPWPEASVKHQSASPGLAGGLRPMPRHVVCISPFPKALDCCCLQNDDLSVTAAVIGVFFFPSYWPALPSVLDFRGEIPSCTCFHSELGASPADGGRGLRQGGVWTSEARELGGGAASRLETGMGRDGLKVSCRRVEPKQCKARACIMLSDLCAVLIQINPAGPAPTAGVLSLAPIF